MSNILDDLFQWAAAEHASSPTETLLVDVAITTNEITRNNLVS